MAANARDLINHKYYREVGGKKEVLEDLLKQAKEKDRGRIPYFMTASRSLPGGWIRITRAAEWVLAVRRYRVPPLIHNGWVRTGCCSVYWSKYVCSGLDWQIALLVRSVEPWGGSVAHSRLFRAVLKSIWHLSNYSVDSIWIRADDAYFEGEIYTL